MKWIGSALADWGKRNPAIIEAAADEFDCTMEEDRKAYLQSLNEENAYAFVVMNVKPHIPTNDNMPHPYAA